MSQKNKAFKKWQNLTIPRQVGQGLESEKES
jgi:hypothetical protein